MANEAEKAIAESVVEQPKVETVVEPKVEEKVEAKVEAKPEGKAEVAPVKDDWKDKRIAQLTAKVHEAQRAAAAKQAVMGVVSPVDQTKIDELVEQRAAAKAAEIAFNKECNDMVEQGKESFPDFDTRLAAFTKINDPTDSAVQGKYWTLVRGLLETGDGARLIHELSQDLDTANRLMNLSPTKLGFELAKLAQKAPPEPVSNAPKPITPVGQKSVSHIAIRADDPDRAASLSTKEWMARRQADVNAKYAAARGR